METATAKKRGRPKGPGKTLHDRDKLLIRMFLESHKIRAERGLDITARAIELVPGNKQQQGMWEHFSKLLGTIRSMEVDLDMKQDWLPIFAAEVARMDGMGCPPQL